MSFTASSTRQNLDLGVPMRKTGNRRYTGQVGIDTSSDGVEHKRWLPSWHEGGLMLLTFALVVIGWVIFRADSIASAYRFIIGMTDWSGAFYAGNEVSCFPRFFEI